ncbi:unnamed protein product [Natator depressus]
MSQTVINNQSAKRKQNLTVDLQNIFSLQVTVKHYYNFVVYIELVSHCKDFFSPQVCLHPSFPLPRLLYLTTTIHSDFKGPTKFPKSAGSIGGSMQDSSVKSLCLASADLESYTLKKKTDSPICQGHFKFETRSQCHTFAEIWPGCPSVMPGGMPTSTPI